MELCRFGRFRNDENRAGRRSKVSRDGEYHRVAGAQQEVIYPTGTMLQSATGEELRLRTLLLSVLDRAFKGEL